MLCFADPDVSDTHRGDLRLSNGTSSSGVLEMWLDGEWQAICSTAFSIAAANISCRQLGFSAGAMAFYTDGRCVCMCSRRPCLLSKF